MASGSWSRRTAKRLRRVRRTVHRGLRARFVDARDTLRAAAARRVLRRHRRGTADTAVVLHVFYPELWPALATYLERLDLHAVDLVVTVPPQHRSLASDVRERFPRARCVVVPNRGRDVLPFLLVAEALFAQGYVSVLKIHAKKSVHFDGGDHWRDHMLEELLPTRPEVLSAVLETLARPSTGLVGPRGSYFALSTYWAGNAATVRRLVEPAVPPERLELLDRPQELGFFAGTMFWARLDAIAPLLHQHPRDFVREPTPKDGTLAHALERAFGVLPELMGRDQYDCDGTTVGRRPAQAEPLPAWYREATRRAKEAQRGARPAGPGGAT